MSEETLHLKSVLKRNSSGLRQIKQHIRLVGECGIAGTLYGTWYGVEQP